MRLVNSPITKLEVFGRKWLIKRDDLLDVAINGNKARKLYRFAANGFGAKTIVSYGGAQSNAMYSISAMAKSQNVEFIYYTKKLPSILKKSPSGNLKAAFANDMQLIELEHGEYETKIEELLADNKSDTLLIRQGGADEYARDGLKLLADELNEFARSQNLKNPIAVTSSGTGTTAGYLSEYLNFECLTTPCVSNGEFLYREFERLGVTKKPSIIETKDKIAFAAPHPKLLNIYRELLGAGLEFDLIYDAKCWLAIVENIEYFEGRDVIFIHSGGVLGNETQLARYAHKGLF
jgi:1-aminocyclopropane-1-carboxylate deaminase/D-cysteine desulfhydrase-like pyridoxal-dependent ACC family enzyme